MSTTPEFSATGLIQPDSQWEYLENTIRFHTINMLQEYRKVCAFAVNPNIIMFHEDAKKLDHYLNQMLTVISQVQEALAVLHPKHAGRAGYALGPGDVQTFLSIHEEYVNIQAVLLECNNTLYVPLHQMASRAHDLAVEAQKNANQGNAE